ncbi:hypothetical protein F1728_19165 [Gimesia benthica]|nr:hypothetical protein [Gimesia benthica]QGQ24677.1 hypothetical protein F1728_19165 [Gimesia benthica]
MSLKIDLNTELSSLTLDDKGCIDLQLIQAPTGQPIVGTRLALTQSQSPTPPSNDEISKCRKLLIGTRPKSLTVMSFHPGLAGNEADLASLAADRTIVGLRGIDSNLSNVTNIATNGALYSQSKLSLSSEDVALNVKRGSRLNIFLPDGDTDNIAWAVLNCHDYTHVELLKLLQKHSIELLIVVTYNTATRLFWEYAISDIHRLFCFVVVVNVAELGGSAVFAPFRRIGREKNAQIGAGGQIFGARGAGEFRVDVPMDIAELRSLRTEFRDFGFKAKSTQLSRDSDYVPMVPSEHFMDTFDHSAGPPSVRSDDVIDLQTEWNFKHPRVAVAQLNHIGLDAYISTKYRIRNHDSCDEFEHLLSERLLELESRCRYLGETSAHTLLDMLVFPEVFIPRSFIATLQRFSNRLKTTIVAGIDYPDGDEDENANECVIIRPNLVPEHYRKVTRSQYDAHRNANGDLMPMLRGSKLVRFVNTAGRGFGVLICYDYSHIDLLCEL